MLNNSDKETARRPFTFDRVVRLIISVALCVGAVWLIDRLKGVLLPFLVAWLIAYLLEPFVQYNRYLLRLKGRLVAILLTLFECALVMTALCVIFVPSIIDECHQMAEIVRHYSETKADTPFIPEAVHEFLRNNIDFKSIAEQLTGQDMESITKATMSLLASGVDIIMGFFNWFIVLLYVVFIMIDYDRLLKGFKGLVPPRYRRQVFKVTHDVQQSMNHYFRGQGLVSACVGIIFAIGFYIIGLPLGVILGLFIGLLNMVPYLQLISLVPCTILCLVYSTQGGINFWTIWWECMALYIICQAIQDLFLTPKIMGRYMGLNPAVILLSLSIWGSLLGLIGLIIALPLTTLILAYYNEYIAKEENKARL